jgi:hypothetical protein
LLCQGIHPKPSIDCLFCFFVVSLLHGKREEGVTPKDISRSLSPLLDWAEGGTRPFLLPFRLLEKEFDAIVLLVLFLSEMVTPFTDVKGFFF